MFTIPRNQTLWIHLLSHELTHDSCMEKYMWRGRGRAWKRTLTFKNKKSCWSTQRAEQDGPHTLGWYRSLCVPNLMIYASLCKKIVTSYFSSYDIIFVKLQPSPNICRLLPNPKETYNLNLCAIISGIWSLCTPKVVVCEGLEF